MLNLKTGKQFDGPSAREQMTRREFGKGLAAIIGAGVAPSIAMGLVGSANASVRRGMMRNVGARNAAVFGGLPYKRKLAYLQSNLGSYIDTGYYRKSNTTFEVKYQYTETPLRLSTIFGDEGQSRLFARWNEGASYVRVYGGDFSYTADFNEHDLKIQIGRRWFFDNVDKGGVNNIQNATLSCVIFGLQYNSKGNYPPVGHSNGLRIFSFTAYEDESKVMSLIPVMSKDDEPCYFDEISNKLLMNIGTVGFSYGEIS